MQTVDKAVKVFARLFQKAAQSRARSPRRCPQTAKFSYRRFLFAKLFLCAYMVKEKASFSIALFWMITPFVYSPNFPHKCGKWTAVVNGGSSPNRKRFRTTAAAVFLISTVSDQNKGIPQGYAFILVGDGGFGPPKSATTDLQSAPFGHSGNLPYESSLCVNSLELVIGVEPTTC